MSAAILVTGATGFVMANVIRHLAERGHDVVGVDLKPPDHSWRRFVEHLPGRVSFRQVDVTDRTAAAVLLQDIRPARAVHGAAITSIPIDVERARFVETSDVNVTGTLNVLAVWSRWASVVWSRSPAAACMALARVRRPSAKTMSKIRRRRTR